MLAGPEIVKMGVQSVLDCSWLVAAILHGFEDRRDMTVMKTIVTAVVEVDVLEVWV